MKKFRKFDVRLKSGPRPRREGAPRPGAVGGKPGDVPRGRPVVGIHGVRELIKVRPRSVVQIWLREGFESNPSLKSLADDLKRLSLQPAIKPVGVLDKFVGSHQGIVAFSSESPELNWSELKLAERSMLVALDEVEDPHNLGAVLRTCWLFGAAGVLTPEVRSASLSPAVSKVAQGAVEHVPVVRESALPEQLKQLKDQGFWILGMSHKGKQSLFSLKIPEKVVWVMGSESSGLRTSTERACDDLVAIPQGNPDASYNVSVATGIALAETYRQWNS